MTRLWPLLLWFAIGCGAAPEGTATEEAALTSGCNAQSDPSCVGSALGATCESTGKCRRDPDYSGACDCVVPAPPPPVSGCHCSDGTAVGSACRIGGTCRPVLSGQIFYCACQ